jgi:hypothetical protein
MCSIRILLRPRVGRKGEAGALPPPPPRARFGTGSPRGICTQVAHPTPRTFHLTPVPRFSGPTAAGSAAPVTSPAFDVAIVSDVLFIALRDGLLEPLRECIKALTTVCRCVVFGFEERLIYEEDEFMRGLADATGVTVAEVPGVEARKEGAGLRGFFVIAPETGDAARLPWA